MFVLDAARQRDDAPQPRDDSPAEATPHAGSAPALLRDDVIEDARLRQRLRRRRFGASLIAAACGIAAGLAASGGGGGSGAALTIRAGHRFVEAGAGLGVSVPRGWHLYRPPITSTIYPRDRLLLTSYATATGGQCAPTRAESAMPHAGALIYLVEYAAAPAGMRFRPQSTGVVLPHGAQRNYECSTVPAYLVRFRAADRLFQAIVAFGGGATARTRAEAMRILAELRASRHFVR